MSELKEVANYVSEKIDVASIKMQDYISTDNMHVNRGGITDCVSLPQTTRATKYLPGDVLVSNIRPYFKKIWYADRTSGCSNDVIVFRVNNDKMNSKFLYYVLSQDSFFDFMMAGSNGTKMPRGNKKTIPDFIVPEFDINKQNKIADILSAYDDLIENNQKQIKLLEEAAQRLYKEWFVDLHFPGYEDTKIVDGVPEGWKKTKVGDIVATSSGGTPSRSNPEYYRNGEHLWLKTKELSDEFIFDTEEKITDDAIKRSSAKKFKAGNIIMAMYGATIGKLGISSLEMTCNQACCVFDMESFENGLEYLYCWLRDNRNALILKGKGSAQPNLSQDLIKNIDIILPSHTILERFSKIAHCNFALKEKLEKQIRLSQQARDRLLPKLMSGELEI